MPNTLDYERLSPGAPHNFPLWLSTMLTFAPLVWMWLVKSDEAPRSIRIELKYIASIAYAVNVVVVLIVLVTLLKLKKIHPRGRAILVRDVYWGWFIMGATLTLLLLVSARH